MELNHVPAEVLSLILGQLRYVGGEWDDPATTKHLCGARLVCRQWNTLASRILFRTIPLRHNRDDGEFAAWNAAVDSELVKQTARVVKVYSGPHDDMEEGRDLDVWAGWEAGDWEEFQQAISRLADLPNINEVYVRFSERCVGVETTEDDWQWDDYEVEKASTRLNTLRHVFKAMEQHKARHGTIRALSIENLANHPIPDEVLSSDTFQTIVKDINTLRITVTAEYTEPGPDHDLEAIERKTFEPFLQNKFLPHFADQLTSLHLGSSEFWGVAPGTFDGGDLVFPHLKTLHLFNFVIAHDDHFDWVLRQTSLERLYLNCCNMFDYLLIWEEEIQRWGVKTHDWHKDTSGVVDDWHNTYRYDGTWEAVFDRIREKLRRLIDFRMTAWEHPPEFALPDFRAELLPSRYLTYYTGILPDRYIDSAGNRGESAEKGDMRAFEELVQVTRERRARKMP
ncbi:hypothetical protein QBC44DRAFT_238413 [Cladorrhinum sp. PSN332]|nr:hypothetical protein QBC44DRAFT_238413 [Cladorrhinum sp. PSN332]